MLKLIIAACAVVGIMGQRTPTPVDDFDVAKHLGNYYQMYSNKYSLDQTQPNNSTCATIQYGLNGTSVTVDNRYRQYTPTGDLDRTTGKAMAAGDNPAILTVSFDGIPATFDYYIIKTGPVVANMYEYAVVTDSNSYSLFVLARDPTTFKSTYNDEVMDFLTADGFTGESAPIETYQDSDCEYPKSFMPPTPVPAVDLEAYIGSWCQMYTNKNTRDQSQPNSFCVTINYEKLNDTAVIVKNTYYEGSPSGREDITNGYAYLTATPGVLDVKFDNVPGMFSYYVIKLGPIEGGLYSYAVVTDVRKFSLFVLVRDCEDLLDDSTKQEVLDFLEFDNGFDGLTNSPQETYHGDDCKYTAGAGSTTVSLSLLFLAITRFFF